jgi:hypothetical protein
MAELKTKLNQASVETFLNAVADEDKRNDSFTLLKLMQQITKMEPKMWGAAIVGFGSYTYKYDSGHGGTMPLAAFSPRKQNLTVYLMGAIQGHEDLLKKLGKHKTGKGCLYISSMKDIDTKVLTELIQISIAYIKSRNR